MLVTSEGCELALERGPGCLIVRLRSFDPESPDALGLAERIWALLDSHLTYRLVLEMDDIFVLHTALVAQLVRLHRRIAQRGGMIRLTGLSPCNQEVLQICGLDERLPVYDDRFAAVKGEGPHWPR